MNTLAIIIACGKEEQIASGTDTAFLSLGNSPVIVHSLRAFQECDAVEAIILAVPKDRVDATLQVVRRFGCTKVRGIVAGASGRMNTLRKVYAKLPEPANTIVIHEASRPFVTPEVIEETVKASKRYGCAIAAHRIQDAVKVVPKGLKPDQTLARNSAWATQTPQAFKAEVLEKIIDPKNQEIKVIDDESEWVSKPAEVHLVEAGPTNMKIRSASDLIRATAIFNEQSGH